MDADGIEAALFKWEIDPPRQAERGPARRSREACEKGTVPLQTYQAAASTTSVGSIAYHLTDIGMESLAAMGKTATGRPNILLPQLPLEKLLGTRQPNISTAIMRWSRAACCKRSSPSGRTAAERPRVPLAIAGPSTSIACASTGQQDNRLFSRGEAAAGERYTHIYISDSQRRDRPTHALGHISDCQAVRLPG